MINERSSNFREYQAAKGTEAGEELYFEIQAQVKPLEALNNELEASFITETVYIVIEFGVERTLLLSEKSINCFYSLFVAGS